MEADSKPRASVGRVDPPSLRRVLALFALVLGLVAMHASTGSIPMGAMVGSAMPTAAMPMSSAPMAASSSTAWMTEVDTGASFGANAPASPSVASMLCCAPPTHGPESVMMLMTCALTLLATALLLLSPALRDRFAFVAALRAHLHGIARTARRIPPPSLTALSISRT